MMQSSNVGSDGKDFRDRDDRHQFDDDGVCIRCGHDGAEASYYSKRGYAHEYEGTEICKGGHRWRSYGS